MKWGVLVIADVTLLERAQTSELDAKVTVPGLLLNFHILNFIILLWSRLRNCPDIDDFKTTGQSQEITLVADILCCVY